MHDSSQKPRVLLIGNGPTAPAALRSLIARCRVSSIVRDLPGSVEDPVRLIAESNEIPVLPLEAPKEIAAHVAETRPDAVVISSFNRILPQAILSLSRFINVHFSPLPRYRGRANVNWALINGDPTAAISIHTVVPGLDSGNILHQEEIPIGPSDTATSLYEKLNAIQERVLGDAVIRMFNGDTGLPQDHRSATYGCARIPQDGEIDWRSSTQTIDRLIRALAPPFPGAFTFLDSQPLIISRAAPLSSPPNYSGRVPGRIIGRSGSEGWVDVLTGDTVLRLLEVVPASGVSVPPASIIRSTRATLGLSKYDLLQRIGTLEARLAALEANNFRQKPQK